MIKPPLELKKKERGKQKYQARMARAAEDRMRSVRTRPSDRCAPRITDGIAANHADRVCRRPVKPITLEDLGDVIDQIDFVSALNKR